MTKDAQGNLVSLVPQDVKVPKVQGHPVMVMFFMCSFVVQAVVKSVLVFQVIKGSLLVALVQMEKGGLVETRGT